MLFFASTVFPVVLNNPSFIADDGGAHKRMMEVRQTFLENFANPKSKLLLSSSMQVYS